MPPVSEKVNVLNKESKKSCAEVAKIYSEDESTISESVKDKEIHASFVAMPQNAKVTATVHTCLVTVEKD